MRMAVLNLTLIIPATACHQRNYVERYSRYNAGLSLTIVPHAGMGPRFPVAMTAYFCALPRAVEGSQAGGVTHTGRRLVQARTCGSCIRVALSHVGRAAHRSRRQPCMGGKTTAHLRLAMPHSHRPCAHGFLRVHCNGYDDTRTASARALAALRSPG